MNYRRAYLGGTFNPVHYGHLRMAEEVREALGLERVVFILSCNPPLKDEDILPAEQRLHMLKMAIEDNPYFEVSDIECRRQGPSYTIDTVRQLKEIYPDEDVLLIVGLDSFLELHLWHRYEELLKEASFIVVSRPPLGLEDLLGSAFVDNLLERDSSFAKVRLVSGKDAYYLQCTHLDISSSEIRRRVCRGQSIRYLLPQSVESFIISRGLYR
jgi:nicotinate-nucleotide adenylyltransferase